MSSLTPAASRTKRVCLRMTPISEYLSRYTHRVAIANSRLIACDEQGVTFNWKDYRIEGRDRYKRMTLATDEFIRRFLIHVLPKGLHRIRHYGLFAKGSLAPTTSHSGSIASLSPCADDFRSSPISRHLQSRLLCLKARRAARRCKT